MKIERTIATLACLALVCVAGANSAVASDADDLVLIVQDFLSNADKEDAHERFWADDLVYTSSSGLRFSKAKIMQGFDEHDDSEHAADDESEITYSGEDIDVRLYGDTAVVVFKLVGRPSAAASETLYYFNTGTFLKRDGEWSVVAWQATKIP